MAKETINTLKTLRIIPKSENPEDTYHDVLALQIELIYELSPYDEKHSRQQTFMNEHYHAQMRGHEHETEYRLYFPGPKLWIDKMPSLKAETEEEKKKLVQLAENYEFVEFRVQRNGGGEEYVPLLFDNIRLILNKLNIEELQADIIPESIKKRKYYQEKGGYEKARASFLHPELRNMTLEDSLKESYKNIDGKLPLTAPLFDILKDYSRIVYKSLQKI